LIRHIGHRKEKKAKTTQGMNMTRNHRLNEKQRKISECTEKKISRYPAPQKKNTGCQRFNRLLAQENIQLAPSAGKHSIGAKRGKTFNWCQARENIQLVPSVRKQSVPSAKRIYVVC